MKKVFVNGTFDLLHPGHVSLLTFAKQQGDLLLVAIDSDERVKQLKGDSRPILNQDIRKQMLLSLKPVDYCRVFDSAQQLRDLVKHYSPDIMVVGSDYKDKSVIGSEYAKKLLFYSRDLQYSSSKIINTILNS